VLNWLPEVVLLGGVLRLKAHPGASMLSPLVVVLWYLKSIDTLDPIPLRLHGWPGRRPLRVAARRIRRSRLRSQYATEL